MQHFISMCTVCEDKKQAILNPYHINIHHVHVWDNLDQ